MNQLADFNQICMDIIKIGFSDLDLIFKITARHNPPKLSQKVFVCMLSHGPLDGMLTRFASIYKLDRINSLFDFDDLDLIFKVTAS